MYGTPDCSYIYQFLFYCRNVGYSCALYEDVETIRPPCPPPSAADDVEGVNLEACPAYMATSGVGNNNLGPYPAYMSVTCNNQSVAETETCFMT